MSKTARPLSPHLQIYRWSVTMASSITHRATGVALSAGTVLLTWWLLAAASGPDAFATAQACLSSLVGRLVLFGFTWAICYHLLNGIRHLHWDAGIGFSLKASRASGWAVYLGSVVLTLVIWVIGYLRLGVS